MTEPGSIRWDLPPDVAALGTLPITVHDTSGSVVVKGLSGRDVAVPEGEYRVTATLPDGHEIVATDLVSVSGGAASARPVFVAARRQAGVAIAPAEQPAAGRDAADGDAKPLGRIEARLWRGSLAASLSPNGFALDDSGYAAVPLVIPEAGSVRVARTLDCDELLVYSAASQTRLRVLPFDAPITGLALGQDRAIELRSHRGPKGLDVQLASSVSGETNAFLDFVDNGLLADSRTLSADSVRRGESAMGGTSLLRALLGAYVLLRANELDGVEAWVDRLASIEPVLPDAHAIRVELLARLARHAEAVEALKTALRLSCPWFRSGISYVLERLRLYLDVAPDVAAGLGLDDAQRPGFEAGRLRLEGMARQLDTRRLFTTFVQS